MNGDNAGVTHRPGPDGLFATKALCGADPTATLRGVLRMHQTDYDCLVCEALAPDDAPDGWNACEGQPYDSFSDAMAAAMADGFDTWQSFTCHLGHHHWRARA